MSIIALRHAISRNFASLSVLGMARTLRVMWRRKRSVLAAEDPVPRQESEGGAPERKSLAAEERFEAEGGHPVWVPPLHGGENEETRTALMRDLAIGFDGRQYTCGGYRYEKLEDAVRHAGALRTRKSIASIVP